MVETPTIDKYVGLKAREATRAYKEFRKEHDLWLEAYKDHDIRKVEAIAKTRDAKAKKAIKACQNADKFLKGIYRLWEIKYYNAVK